MAEKRYLICPGRVRSWGDGDIHSISAAQLMDLYGVDPQACVVLTDENRRSLNGDCGGLTPLAPDPTGRYERPQ